MLWDPDTLLMVDPALLESVTNVSLVREEAYKEDQPLIRLEDKRLTMQGKASDIQFRMLHKQDGVYRLWYSIWGINSDNERFTERNKYCAYAYAESSDGRRFKPVNLNQVRYNGNKRNNLLDLSVPGVPGVSQSHFMHDPLDSDFPYKCLYYRPAHARDIEPGIQARMHFDPDKDFRFIWGIARSKDGLHWQPPEHEHNLINACPETARLHRAMDGAYVISDQMTSPVQPNAGREVKGWISHDGLTAHRVPGWMYELPQHMTRLYPEFSGVPGPMQFNNAKWVQPHIGLACARKGPTILGLSGYLYYPPIIETYAQHADVGLVVSSDGVAFREVLPFRPFIPRGPRGAWDHGLVCQGAIIDDAGQTRFYYTGNNVGNLGGHYQIGMAHIPRDRYGYLLIRGHRDTAARAREALATFKPVTLPADAKLAINASHFTRHGSVRLQLSNDNGKPIKGFTFADCQPMTKESLRQTITWKNNKSVASLAGRTVRLSLRLDHPDCGFVGSDSPRVYAIYLK